ncbi:elongation of very long chain fatty acids protein AAEL008004 [Drosophila serrata]|uniref:elongation of very long chain fatty acids protein AAEL008004-like n=1 Tax=Drosophila serrata TaxID=7274 RepID=UPI000A1D174E|nr:elongation of very long chain fatty acids protein AAEL008004-like [Drosophila serrata]XP_020814546.1 elongation of very long chain fatty acids protein AAEL008004 [Drosophila serrata]
MEAATSASRVPAVVHPAVMSDPWFMLAVLGVYLYFVTVVGPQFMEFRKAYKLKKLIMAHNLIQVVSCLYVLKEVFFITDNAVQYFWECRDFGKSQEHVRRHFELAHFLFWLKLSELIETVIFVLRRKQNQVSKLHIFHHITTVTLVYVLLHFNENGTAAYFCVFLNSIVHICMYTYYFVAAVADKDFVRSLRPIKKCITVMQMTQFAFILTQVVFQLVLCGIPAFALCYYTGVIAAMFYGFYDFYQTSYQKNKRHKSLTTPN